MAEPIYTPLRPHTEFSATGGMMRIRKLIARAQERGSSALSISDLMNEFGLVKFYKACHSAGIKPAGVVDVWIGNPNAPDKLFRTMPIIRNDAGYLRLSEFLTTTCIGKDRNAHHAELNPEWLENSDNSGSTCLSGAHYDEVGVNLLNGSEDAAWSAALKYAVWFPDAFCLELQRLPEHSGWEACVSGSVRLAKELGLPVVTIHPAQFMSRDGFSAHETRVRIAGGWVLTNKKRPCDFTSGQFLIPPGTMLERFAGLPEALGNTVEVVKHCNIHIMLGRNFLPLFPTPDGLLLDDYLVKLSNGGLQERMVQLYPDEAERVAKMSGYQERLDFESNIIIQMKFPGYFLIIRDFINWAKTHDYPVGPGRGSGAGSLVACSLKVTDLDPPKYALLFECFLSPERISMPGSDVDFCQSNRDRMIEYVRNKYGAQVVSRIVTLGMISSKVAIHGVGCVPELLFTPCDKLSRLAPLEASKPLDLDDATRAEPQIQELIKTEEADELITLAKKLEDLTCGLGMCAGGVLIALDKTSDYDSVYQADESVPSVFMYDKGDMEDVGLMKFDFLGLRSLTTIEMARSNIENTAGDIVDVGEIPLDDQVVYKILRDVNTTTAFQPGSTSMKKILKTAHTTKFEGSITFVSLYRPGPMNNILDFVAHVKGQEFQYIHPLLEGTLVPTHGIMVYQE